MLDLHRKKAAEIFGIPEDQVTPEQRRFGKMENFREIYSNPQSLLNVTGTTTGRISSTQPAIANLPTGSAEARRVVTAFRKNWNVQSIAGGCEKWFDKPTVMPETTYSKT